ncbi:hypothetical protein HPB49_017999 [Dermacentor silvarum]|uniref:Uncharacterized protein n=1 Tax=Dermacentor silvarum TaxID=543639 RepID=A0ACB8DF38_DERSI|nr:ubiquitin-conjugating enzyme E2 Z [Dermacentor silvarum]KAH7966603.1 hypothetical protein HPB49_017999 [Dermacentor silvarum]
MAQSWNPLNYQNEVPSPQCLMRVKRDIADFNAQPPAGLFIAPEGDDVTRIHALIVGPSGTPYEGGFFQFYMKCPPDYPISPPRVRIMTTDAGRVRFNPNLYACGKVCLSILGTWTGPPWSPAQSIESVLISVQSLMTEKPYYNEPGFVIERVPGEADRYSDYIRHETIRVAVCDQVEAALKESPDCPAAFREQILKSFSESYSRYEEIVKGKLHLTGVQMKDVFSLDATGQFQYEGLLTRMQGLKEQIKQKIEAAAAAEAAEAAAAAEGAGPTAAVVTAATNTNIIQ